MNRYSQSTIDRVSNLLKQFSGEGCYEWPLSKTAAGYGQLSNRIACKNRNAYAHRVAHLIATGSLAVGMDICHRCDNPGCINPSHLFEGTAKDNLSDMAAKGRSNKGKKLPIGKRHWSAKNPCRVRGSENGNSRLTDSDVKTIYASSRKGVDLARQFGVTPSCISAIRKGKLWSSVTRASERAPKL